MRPLLAIPTLLLLLVALQAAGCGASDPRQEILDQRARWEVRILNWAQEPGGDLNVSTRVSGPPTTRLDRLTVRFSLLDESGAQTGEHWYTYDLARVPRGGPSDILVRIPGGGRRVDGLAVSLVYEPTDEEARRIPELAIDTE